jgi:hypothetical protein
MRIRRAGPRCVSPANAYLKINTLAGVEAERPRRLGADMDDSFQQRERQFEAMFVHDEELKFKIVARRSRLFAAWIADRIGAGAPPDYADGFIAYAFGRSPETLIEHAQHDLHIHGVALADVKLRKAFEQLGDQARAEVMNK